MMLFGLVATVGMALAMQSADPSGSPARATQDMFDVGNKESDYFEHNFNNNIRAASESYADSLRFANCAVRMNSKAVGGVLANDAESAEERTALSSLTRQMKGCAVRRDSVSALFMRGALAEALWKEAGANPNPTNRNSIDLGEIEAFMVAKPAGTMSARVSGMPLSYLARCQVMVQPTLAANVLSTEPGSAEEKAAAEALYAKSTPCGIKDGLGKTTSLEVRASVADAFWSDRKSGATGRP